MLTSRRLMLLVGPILAQVATVSVGDRTEARYVATVDRHYEAATRPLAGLQVDWQHFDLTLRYGPTLTVVPLESKSRELIAFHNAYLGGVYHWGHTQLEVSEAGGYGEQNFYVLALTDPRANSIIPTQVPTGTTGSSTGTGGTGAGVTGAGAGGTGTSLTGNGTGTTTPATAINSQTLRFVTSTTTLAFQHEPSLRTALRAEVSYLVSGAALQADRKTYPLLQGPRGLLSERYVLTRSDALASTQTVQYVGASTGDHAWIANANELWIHKFSAETTTQLGVGLSGSRSPAVNGYIAYSIFPTFVAGIVNVSSLERGKFSISLLASSAPAIDLITGAVDPRLSFGTITGWARDRFSVGLGADGSISLASHSQLGSLSAVGAGAGVAYRLGDAASVDAGVRVAYQNFQGTAVIPLSEAIFVGVNIGLDQRL